MPDETEEIRRELVPLMPLHLVNVQANGGQVWTTEQMREEFDVLGFAAPLCIVKRKSDGIKGCLFFTHAPRFYFDWQEGDDDFQKA